MCLCGIDEAGRGPLAGPLVMAGVVLHEAIEGLDDSKRLSEKKREALFTKIQQSARWHLVRFEAEEIDQKGMAVCLALGLKEIKANLAAQRYLFDGPTAFGVEGIETLVKADQSVPEVGAASILAKVTRDRLMVEAARLYPGYGFEKHKGYGTKSHIEALRRLGPSPIHRRSFRVKAIEQPSLF